MNNALCSQTLSQLEWQSQWVESRAMGARPAEFELTNLKTPSQCAAGWKVTVHWLWTASDLNSSVTYKHHVHWTGHCIVTAKVHPVASYGKVLTIGWCCRKKGRSGQFSNNFMPKSTGDPEGSVFFTLFICVSETSTSQTLYVNFVYLWLSWPHL